MRDNLPANILAEGAAGSGLIKIGEGGDWPNLDVAVNDLLQGIPEYMALAAVMGVLSAAIAVNKIALLALGGPIKMVVWAFGLLRNITFLQTAAQWLLNSALWANPMTWVVIGVVALIAAVGALIYWWSDLKAAFLDTSWGKAIMLAGLRADIGTLGELNLTAGGNSTHSTAGNATETVGKDQSCTVKGSRTIGVAGAQTTTTGGNLSEAVGGAKSEQVTGASVEGVGADKSITAENIFLQARGKLTCTAAQGGISLFGEINAALQDIRAALAVLAAHTHPQASVIDQGGEVANKAASLGGHISNLGSAAN